MNSSGESYYSLLEVPENASQEEIKTAYRNKVKLCHPDLDSSDPARVPRFLEVQKAYETLSDQHKRQEYDKKLSEEKATAISKFFSSIGEAKTRAGYPGSLGVEARLNILEFMIGVAFALGKNTDLMMYEGLLSLSQQAASNTASEIPGTPRSDGARTPWRKLRFGMSQEEVRSVLGEPDRVDLSEESHSVLWLYDLASNHVLPSGPVPHTIALPASVKFGYTGGVLFWREPDWAKKGG